MPGSLTGTIGLTLSSCAPPGSNDIFELGPDEMEVGLGGYFISATCIRLRLQSLHAPTSNGMAISKVGVPKIISRPNHRYVHAGTTLL